MGINLPKRGQGMCDFKDGDIGYDRLKGLDPVHADWHAKVNLYQVNSQ